jgi:hypothetical protein
MELAREWRSTSGMPEVEKYDSVPCVLRAWNPSTAAALAALNVNNAYIDGELCAGAPDETSFSSPRPSYGYRYGFLSPIAICPR